MDVKMLMSLAAAAGIVGFGIWGRICGEESLRGLASFWYPAITRLYTRTGLEKYFIKTRSADSLRLLRPWESGRSSAREYICRLGSLILTGCTALLVLSAITGAFGEGEGESQLDRREEGIYLARGEPAGQEESLYLNGSLVDEEGNAEKLRFEVIVPNRAASEDEAELLLDKAEVILEKMWLNHNTSADAVRTDLNLIREIPGTSITVDWDTGGSFLIAQNGQIWNDDISEEGEEAELTATLTLGSYRRSVVYRIRILPRAEETEEQLQELLEEYLTDEAARVPDGNVIQLPSELNGYQISWEEEEKEGIPIFLFLPLIVFGIAAAGNARLSEGLKRRNNQLAADYPEIVSKLSLFLGAGMSIRMAWGRLVGEYSERIAEGGERRFAYEEMRITWNELCVGTSEEDAFERFGRNVGAIAYIRFGTLLAQNVRRGGAHLTAMLEAEEAEAFAGRRERAKREGEEAGTKLLGPMLGMLIIVIVIVVLPAFWSM